MPSKRWGCCPFAKCLEALNFDRFIGKISPSFKGETYRISHIKLGPIFWMQSNDSDTDFFVGFTASIGLGE